MNRSMHWGSLLLVVVPLVLLGQPGQAGAEALQVVDSVESAVAVDSAKGDTSLVTPGKGETPAQVAARLCDTEAKAFVKVMRDSPPPGRARIPKYLEAHMVEFVKQARKLDKVGACK